ncbi:glycine oxidase ThiO [Micromonospora purpureochromogenes]|uniref:glycine oxidase ThiO n=1 Tax=Micromonospora purpureochromogenes TaxID=47872 RepID=UPI003401A9F4
MTHHPDVAIVGAGIVGLTLAWRCAQRGLTVTVFHDELPGTSSAAAPGMLSPVSAGDFPDPLLLKFAEDARRRWPGFAVELAGGTGTDLGYSTTGILLVAHDAADHDRVSRMYNFRDGSGGVCEPLDARGLRAREPLLASDCLGGGYVTDDHYVDAQRVVAALRAAVRSLGVRFVDRRVRSLDELSAGAVVVAAGAWSGDLLSCPVTPVKGQVVLLHDPSGRKGIRHAIRGVVGGEPVYLADRPGGFTVVAATMEHAGFDAQPTDAGTGSLLRKATALVPTLAHHDVVAATAGLRPDTPDHLPLMGEVPARPRIFACTGHYRHGVLLAPLIADRMTALIVDGVDDIPAAFAPGRFDMAALTTGSAKEGSSA